MITFEILHSVQGDKPPMYFEDATPEKRQELAATIATLMKAGHAVFLIQGKDARRIKGYDPETNDWLVMADPTQAPKGAETQRQRVQYYFDPEVIQAIDDMKNKTGLPSRVEIIRQALGYLRWFLDEVAQGNELLICKQNGELRGVIFPHSKSVAK